MHADALAALCDDLGRQPQEPQVAAQLATLLPPCEQACLSSINALFKQDVNAGISALDVARQTGPGSCHGAFLFLLAFVAWSDAALQAAILTPYRKQQTAMQVIKPVRATALLEVRDPKTAWTVFCDGVDDPGSTADAYQKGLRVSIGADLRNAVLQEVQNYCRIGQALVLYDACLYEGARAAAIYASGFLRSSGFPFGTDLAKACEQLDRGCSSVDTTSVSS
jgi:hypothetical protein